MKPLVAELLLRSAPGPPWLLLRELCWDPESGELPEADRVETLRLCVDGLRAEVERRVEQARGGEPWCPASGREKSTASGAAAAEEEEEEGITGALREVASGRCLPLLQRLRERGRGRLVHSLCALLSGCCREAAPSLTGDIARLALGDVRAHSEERSAGAAGESGAGVAPLLPRLPEGLELRDRVLSAVLTAVRAGDEGLASRAAARVIPALLATGVPLERLWDEVKSCEGPTGGPGAGCRRLLLLSSLSDHLFPPHRDGREAPDLRRCPEFWRVLQRGLVHRDNVSRKRAVYLLKRAVDVSRTLRDPCLFWWLAEKNKLLVQLWENYILIMETLEENQVHVIRPVLPRLCSLLDATVSKGISLFHTSWVLCAYKRMFASENKTIIKEGLFHFLDVNVTKYPFITRMLSEFICGPLMDALSESTLYSRSPEQTVGSCPLLGVKLQVLLITFVESVPEQSKGDFLLQLIKSMGSKYWCAIPILFISRALAQIPSCKAWGVEGLHALREVLRCTMITHQVLLRGAAQCYLLQTTMNLTDVVWELLILRYTYTCQYISSNLLGQFLYPLLDSLRKLNTHAYLPVVKADKSLQLLLKLLETCSSKCLMDKTEGQLSINIATVHSIQLYIVLNRVVLLIFLNALVSAALYSNDNETGSSIQGWGKIAAQFVCNQWICIHFAFNKCDQFITSSDKNLDLSLPVVENPALTLQACTEALSIVPSDQVLPILQCMRILIPKVLGSREPLCVESLDLAWKAVLDLNSNQLYFWPTLNAFIKIAFHHQLLGVSHSLKPFFSQILNQLFEISQTKIGVFNVLIAHCCQTWLPAVSASNTCLQDSFAIAQNHIDLFVEACLFGPVFRKDQRLIQDVHIFIELQGDDCAANVTTESENKDDQFVRIWAISFLCHLDGSDSLHKNFIEKLVNKLLEKDNELRNKKGRYYVNSMYHRVKTRIWQTLLVLLHHLDQNFVRKILETVYLSGFSDNQASVKYLIEWFIILILHKWPEFLDSFWRCFRFKQENTKSSICTFLAILVHIDVILKNVEEKVNICKALSVILPWCLNHNFSVRLYALLALQKVWEACQLAKMEGDDLQFLEPIVESSLEQAGHKQSTGNAGKNWQRIQEHFFFETFQPLEDYSLETFFYTFPSLSDVIEDEWIPVWKFKRVMDLSSSTSVVNLFNSRNKLSELKSTDWVQRDKADLDAEWTDVQKKIIPWKNSIPDQDLELIYQERATKLGKSSNSSSSLIVVASLIDKPTNLGGLCRTSEIFGASVLVVNNMHCVNDKQFQALSVSAEQWMPVIEVKPAQLVEYLQQKKTEGYTIIGVEQTANSQDLTQYRFPEKTLLLLGNEREGIPANLIQHLDVCVEIPQYGVIRSLNVHVSGALLVWEYTRQQMMTNSSGP
uniref:tRNA (guanosine(18)-2'-O)-methyltransferase TARBP1 n=1 Tax=Callorhinchus milii TaxID=7868 RepID=A0A4W3K2G7_CALMI